MGTWLARKPMIVNARVSFAFGTVSVYRPLVPVSVVMVVPFKLTRTAGSRLLSTAEVTVPVTRTCSPCPQTRSVDTRTRVAARLVANNAPPGCANGREHLMDSSPGKCSSHGYHAHS